MAKKKSSEEGEKGESKVSQNVVLAIIGSITTIAVAVIPLLINKANSEPPPSPTPLVTTATTIPDFPTQINTPTETLVPTPTETTAPTFTPTIELPAATATAQVGIYNVKLATNASGINVATQFKPAQTMYLFFDVNDPNGLNIVKVLWLVVEVKSFKSGVELTSSAYTVKNNHFELGFDHSARPWVPGKYKIQLFLNDVPDDTIEFEIVP
jgi:hypothetical protein